ncbi:Protein strictosidine synthase-like 10 [Vitis vinifera]|uniref:Protein strictosidine synthase-like 10 n=1 Tax=Vitis vinifera TaxID=29760 RepID=A0A438K507_VITVI|nr:Protein strictosidine synthase-like 10 [Vitis vinifera]
MDGRSLQSLPHSGFLNFVMDQPTLQWNKYVEDHWVLNSMKQHVIFTLQMPILGYWWLGAMVVAKQVAISAEGVPFRFTNALDIDQNTGVVYFTDTSTIFQRWAYAIAMQTGDKTGRLLKYDPRSKEVMVLLRGLSFSNGVALSQDNDFVLVTETTAAKVTRYWL